MEYTKKRKIYIGVSAAIVLMIMVAIFFLSAQDGEESTGTSGWFMSLLVFVFGKAPEMEIIRTAAHFSEYAGLGFFVCNLVFSVKNKVKPILCMILSWGYAWSDEIHQIFVPGRAFQLTDLLVDLSGVLLGTTAFGCLIFIICQIKKSNKKTGVGTD